MEKLLKDKVIVVSGGTKGVGRGIVRECAKQGANIVIGGRDGDEAKRILDEARGYDVDGIFVHTDLMGTNDCATLFERTVEKFGKVDGFVNYAGILPTGSLLEVVPEQFDEVFNINIRAAFFCTQQAIKYMRQSGGGSIVVFGSPHAWCGEKDRVVYACSK